MKVLKFGGTSVGTPERMRNVATLVRNERTACIVVLSALSKTTDQLVKINNHLTNQENGQAEHLISTLESHYHRFVEKLYDTEAGRTKGETLINAHFDQIRSFTKDKFTNHEQRTLLAQGELMSTGMFQFYLEECGVESVLLPALDFMRLDNQGEPDLENIKVNLQKLLNESPSKLYITQGYICRNASGEIDNLKRGGSDYSASLIGAAISCSEIQIWTDIDGMHNSDPRHVKNTQSIGQLSFDEAAELAYFGAKILHPSTILPAREFNIPVRLLNTMDPSASGTLITARNTRGQIRAVAAKDGIIAVKIKSTRMLLAYGFLRRVFEVFEGYKTPIDMIATSEIAVSLTIDDPSNIEAITNDLREFGTVEVDQNMTIVCVVGDFVAESKGMVQRVLQSMSDIPVRMISYGGSRHNISLLVSSSKKVQALNALHEGLFNV
jgi:aspartate kinase